MAEKLFNTRIQLKYDTYQNWTTTNPVLKAGEVAIVVVPASTGAVVQEPAILMKVGDGATAFNALSFVAGKAADVYDWAKAAQKPEYTADEITGLSDFISREIEDTDTKYKIEQDADDHHLLKFFSQAKGATEWTLVTSLTTPDTVYDDTALAGRVSAVETLVGSTAVATQIANAIAALDLDTLKATVATLQGTDAGKSARQIANEELAAQLVPEGANESLDTLQEIAAWIQSHPDDASAMNAAISALQNQLTGIGAGNGTVKKYVNDAITALNVGQYALAADLTALAARVTALETDMAGLASIAKSGNVNDLVQTDGDVLVFNCGTAAI